MTNTTLNAVEVAKLTAIITGGGFKRAATKEAAIKRFLTVAFEAGFRDAAKFLGEVQNFETARHRLDKGIKASATTLSVAPSAEAPADESGKGGPGLARLRAKAEAEAIRQSTNDEADAARAAVREQQDALKIAGKDRRTGIDALATDLAPAKPAKAKKVKAEKPAKAPKAEGAATRTRVEQTGTITAVVANPKKPGSRAFAAFAHYKAGQTVADFIAACTAAGIPESEAKANLSWDRRKGFITVTAGA